MRISSKMKEQGLKTRSIRLATAILVGLAASAAQAASVEVKDAWVRGTVPGQQATGAFMRITSQTDTAIVGASSPVAAVTEIHEMRMDGGVMKMRALTRLPLAAGKTLELGPSGYHVMLIKLRQPLRKGDSIPLTLHLERPGNTTESLEIKAEVRDLAAGTAGEHKSH